MEYSCRFFDFSVPNTILDRNKIPIATKCLTIAYTSLTLILFGLRCFLYFNHKTDQSVVMNFSDINIPALQLVPSRILKFPYSIVLSNLVDTSPWRFVFNLINLLIGGSFIERNWNSSNEMIKFTLGIGSITNLVVLLITVTVHYIIPTWVSLDTVLDGNYTVLIGFSIIYRQLLPETTIINIKSPSFISKNFRFKLLPIFVLTIMTSSQLFVFRHFSNLLSIWITFFSCWVYLRFYQILPPSAIGSSTDYYNSVQGDASDTFQLIYFFPDIIKPILRPIFNKTYFLLNEKFGIIKSFGETDIDKGNDIAEQRGAKKVTDEVKDRRRQLALDVLQERLV
ncbi:similar to Saccharomyces cerevisiae YOL107W Putative protein of unknown function [Maudiozyma saulgeensis]|uniref:Peptidase S54 rhomboid domain-containing protein n=1 Tax=Maudiozyma saulgeensis TaxID=1789683 RepID=A0A1X7R8V6_9SACH|nr:similar to Saccharomyces cerevisiae YOL107W Putative protein of unknown function [Kazachstania saulgeensis]